jgi:multidrug efflux pump
MAASLMGGITVATLLTILYLPALYAQWFRVRRHEAPASGSGSDVAVGSV